MMAASEVEAAGSLTRGSSGLPLTASISTSVRSVGESIVCPTALEKEW